MRRLRGLVVTAIATGLIIGLMGAPSVALAGVCPADYALVANEELPVPAPPYGADFDRNGFQCAATQGNLLLLTDDVPEGTDLAQCGSAFSPIFFEPTDEHLTAKDRNGDGIVCIRFLEIADAKDLEIGVVRDN